MRHRKPIYRTRKETVLAEDHIIPYGGRIGVSSESKREALALKLLGDDDDELSGVDEMLAAKG